ncbi:IS5 family transposase [Streptomyces olivaceus]|uniref:IS5 family transposase n=3 Tax=Streptomyces olivaceus TaxID=47716 RepID=A0ABS7WEX7_STROV|nr:IS5 family transposase [Streptomyces olivaceus]MBZ6100720.1 IS5 family transposase [Streptomyces olivaceus]MBZ6121834.1 IS5 family transposase [Streptomyces olivaceus]MBZ6156527.1 IS5 family transposase [Streptomyces olivaceus]MBZ6303085.1 IS5 family transposase [Streptomyces olivaceus]
MSKCRVVVVAGSSPSTPGCDCLAHRFGNAADRPGRRPRYGSDMSDAEWAAVRDLLPVPGWLAGRGGRPEGYCHRQMIDAVRYLVDNGSKWRAMPSDFPPWPRVYAFFARWRDAGLVAELHDRLREAVRDAEGRDREPSAAVIDSQSVKADATVALTSRGYDAGKKINGRKRHLLTDTLGLLLAVLVTPASTTDRDAARLLLPAARGRFARLARVWADGGYTGHLVDWSATRLGVVLDIVRRSDDLRGFQVLPRRWVVERSFAWCLRSRRLVRDYERRTDTSEAVILWSMTMLMSRRLAARGQEPGLARAA